jgi:predicted transcriptional regulator
MHLQEAPMPKTLTLRLDDETYSAFASAAKAERRSLANLIETAALRHIKESHFVDDAEMAEISSDPDLIARLKAGSADAKKRRGRFVPKL